MSRKTIEDDLDTVLFRLQNIILEAREDPAPRLHVNNDGLVVEYNTKFPTGAQTKFYEKIARFEKNKS